MVFGVLQGGRIFSRGRCGAWCFASGRIHTLVSLSVRRSAGGFCMAVAVFGALQGVGCIPWRPLVSATLPVIFGWQVRYLVIFIFIFILYILLPNLILYENNITSHTYIYIYILSACTSHILQITFYTRYIYIYIIINYNIKMIYLYIYKFTHHHPPSLLYFLFPCCFSNFTQNISQYYFVLQNLQKILPSTTLYYNAYIQQ
jgi:hypothetical protein